MLCAVMIYKLQQIILLFFTSFPFLYIYLVCIDNDDQIELPLSVSKNAIHNGTLNS